MGAASGFLSAWLSGLVRRGRLFLGGVGGILAIAGAWSMYSATTHNMNGVATSAVVVERFALCQAEFQPKGESRRKEAMDCDKAYAFQKWAGKKKVKVHKSDHAKVRYNLSDGTLRTADVHEGKAGARGLPIGGTFDAVYDPATPADVRARPTVASMGSNLVMLMGGAVLLALALLPQMMGLFGRSGATRPSATDAAAWGEDALKEAVNRSQAGAQRMSAAAAGKRFGRSEGVAEGSRRQFGARGT